MNIKEEITKLSGINEMARPELLKVLDLIKNGKLRSAAEKYLEVGGSPTGITYTVNSYIKKNPNIDADKLKQFGNIVSKIAYQEKGLKNKRMVPHPTKKIAIMKDGKKETFSGGHPPEERYKKIMGRINKVEKDIQREEDAINSNNDEKIKSVAKQILSDIQADKTVDPSIIKFLRNFISTGKNKDKVIKVMSKIISDGKDNLMKLKDVMVNHKMIKPKNEKKLESIYKKISGVKK